MTSFIRQMMTGPRRILITGHFGSGKTEFAVSLAFALAKLRDRTQMKEPKLALVDLDIENPYFRSRERQEELGAAGVSVYSDPFNGKNGSELQVISAGILAPLQDVNVRVLVDCGGDAAGAMILNQFSRHFREDYQLINVVNCNRPGTDSVEKALEQIKKVEQTTSLRVTGLISNAHMIRYTTKEDVLNGWAFTKEVSKSCGIPVLAACAMDSVADEIEERRGSGEESFPDMEVFRIGMHMRDSYLDKKV